MSIFDTGEGDEFTLIVDSSREVLIVDDEEAVREVLGLALEGLGCNVTTVADAEEALELLGGRRIDLALVDKNLPGLSGIDLMKEARKLDPDLQFMMITGYASLQSALEALRLGAIDYIEKPFNDLTILRQRIQRALEHQRLVHENQVLADHLRSARRELWEKVESQAEAPPEKDAPSPAPPVSEAGERILQENVELKRAINALVPAVKAAQEAARELEGADDALPDAARDLVRHTAEVVRVLANRIRRVKRVGADDDASKT